MCLRFFLMILFFLGMVGCASMKPTPHVVKSGETMALIALFYETTSKKIMDLNSLQNDQINVGQSLLVPLKPGRRLAQLPIKATHFRLGKGVRFFWPVVGKITSFFGRRGSRMHKGIDIASRKGSPVRAAASGHVSYAGNKLRGFGNVVRLEHPNGYSTLYAHLQRFNVRKGQFVRRGQRIGGVGNTGRSTGYHLHFEVRHNDKALNPIPYLR